MPQLTRIRSMDCVPSAMSQAQPWSWKSWNLSQRAHRCSMMFFNPLSHGWYGWNLGTLKMPPIRTSRTLPSTADLVVSLSEPLFPSGCAWCDSETSCKRCHHGFYLSKERVGRCWKMLEDFIPLWKSQWKKKATSPFFPYHISWISLLRRMERVAFLVSPPLAGHLQLRPQNATAMAWGSTNHIAGVTCTSHYDIPLWYPTSHYDIPLWLYDIRIIQSYTPLWLVFMVFMLPPWFPSSQASSQGLLRPGLSRLTCHKWVANLSLSWWQWVYQVYHFIKD